MLRKMPAFFNSFLLSLLLIWQMPANAENRTAELMSDNYVAKIELNTAEELYGVLQKAEKHYLDNGLVVDLPPVTFVLHGAEAHSLVREQYLKNKGLVDLAARLTALKVVKIQVCENWMGGNGIAKDSLQPFVSTIPDGKRYKQSLVQDQNYVYF
jgi:intracellular sulfur oxidation DsrE/DsrF family protein